MEIVSRSEWGARAPRSRVGVNWPAGVDLWVHHTGGDAPPITASRSELAAVVRGIQNFHMDKRGWNDLGYGYLCAPDGTVFEGRGRALAAHSPGKNHEPSVSLIGDYSSIAPTDAQHRSVYALLEELRAGDLRGHRENTSTACPGDAAMEKIVNGPPPIAGTPDPMVGATARQRLIRAGYGPRTADVILDRLRRGISGTVPHASDSLRFRALRDAGFGLDSARKIIRASRAGRVAP